MGKLKVIDFFSGCGGSSLGIEQAGLDMVLAVDLWEDACKTHELNIDCPVWCKDINLIEASELPECDVIIGSPPCQRFSQANYYSRDYDDSLVKRFMEIVEQVNPKYWVWENVVGAKRAMPAFVWTHKTLVYHKEENATLYQTLNYPPKTLNQNELYQMS